MIALHRLGHKLEPFHLNPELIVTVEANPDTVITLTTGGKVVVAEMPQRVLAQIKDHRIEVLAGALQRRQEDRAAEGCRAPVRLTAVPAQARARALAE